MDSSAKCFCWFNGSQKHVPQGTTTQHQSDSNATARQLICKAASPCTSYELCSCWDLLQVWLQTSSSLMLLPRIETNTKERSHIEVIFNKETWSKKCTVEHALATYAQPRCKAKRKSAMRAAIAVSNPVLSTKIGVNMERIPHLAACFQVKKVQTQMSKYGMCSLCTLLHKLTFIHPWMLYTSIVWVNIIRTRMMCIARWTSVMFWRCRRPGNMVKKVKVALPI